jgi:chromosome partitioning protein
MPVTQAVRATTVPGLDLLTASVDLVHADAELGKLRGREGRLRAALAPIATHYDFIFLDCASSLSLLPINAVVAADHFIVPTAPQFLAVTGVENLIAAAERLAWDAGRRVPPLGVLLTMVDYRNKAMRTHVDRIRAEHGALAFAIEIRINTRLAEAPGQGQTIFQYDGKATGAAAYRLLAEEYLIRCGVAAPPARPTVPPPDLPNRATLAAGR